MIFPPSSFQNCRLCLFAKHWVAGTVKTRLGADIGMPSAAQLHHAFVQHLTEILHPTPSAPGVGTPLLATAPDSAVDDVSQLCPSWRVLGQGQGDLGQRLNRLFLTQLGETMQLGEPQRLLVIGADCPDLPLAAVQEAWQRLANRDVVLGPATDGGYYLLGLRGPWQPWMATLFRDIRWSQADVAATTRQRIADAGRSLTELPTRSDVDTLPDLRRLVQRLAATAPTAEADRRLLAAIAAIVPAHVSQWINLDSPLPVALPSRERRDRP